MVTTTMDITRTVRNTILYQRTRSSLFPCNAQFRRVFPLPLTAPSTAQAESVWASTAYIIQQFQPTASVATEKESFL
jgi:hypothetical protein